jgi:hypothetical protein
MELDEISQHVLPEARLATKARIEIDPGLKGTPIGSTLEAVAGALAPLYSNGILRISKIDNTNTGLSDPQQANIIYDFESRFLGFIPVKKRNLLISLHEFEEKHGKCILAWYMDENVAQVAGSYLKSYIAPYGSGHVNFVKLPRH